MGGGGDGDDGAGDGDGGADVDAAAAAAAPRRGGSGGGGGATLRARHVVRVVVADGRKHEVRVLVAAAGMTLRKLHRTRVGGLRLPRDLRSGCYR